MVYKATIIGSGNWCVFLCVAFVKSQSCRGSAIARILGETTRKHADVFDRTVKMWVYEEMVDGRKLSEIINTQHENVKYLPGKTIPDNIVIHIHTNTKTTCVFRLPNQTS